MRITIKIETPSACSRCNFYCGINNGTCLLRDAEHQAYRVSDHISDEVVVDCERPQWCPFNE